MKPARLQGARRHVWAASDETHAACDRCGARARVVLVIVGAGLRAQVQRHGPEKCGGARWWGAGAEPLPPWERAS